MFHKRMIACKNLMGFTAVSVSNKLNCFLIYYELNETQWLRLHDPQSFVISLSRCSRLAQPCSEVWAIFRADNVNTRTNDHEFF